jgi:hypothetical protein
MDGFRPWTDSVGGTRQILSRFSIERALSEGRGRADVTLSMLLYACAIGHERRVIVAVERGWPL